jgi:hypothetical protein
MHHRFDVVGLKNLFKFFLIGEIPFYKESIFDGLTVPSLEVIIDDGLMALTEKLFDHMASYITSPSSDEDRGHSNLSIEDGPYKKFIKDLRLLCQRNERFR